MNTHYLRIARKYGATMRIGMHHAGQYHVWAPNRRLLYALRARLGSQAHCAKYRDRRKAYYIGALIAHRANQRLVSAWRL